MRLNVFNSLIGLCVATAAVSCSDALVNDVDSPSVGGEKSDMISFVVAESNNTTRGGSFGNRPCGGAYLHSANGADSLYLKMEVADITDDLTTRAGDFSSENTPSELYMTCRVYDYGYSYYFENTKFDKNEINGQEIWSSNPAYYWLEDGTNYKFYGYYVSDPEDNIPNGDGSEEADSPGADSPGVKYISGDNDYIPSLDCTISNVAAEHFDLAYSSSAKGDYSFIASGNGYAHLNITHALSKICIKKGSVAGTIEKICITNVYKKGNLNLESGNWNIYGKDEGYTSEDGNYIEDVTLTFDEDNSDNNSFMLLPGCITNTSMLEVYLADKTEPYRTSLAEISWEAGKKYTYTINIMPDLEIDLVPETVDAHYVIAKAHINADNLPAGEEWILTVSATLIKDEDVSVVSELSSYQKEGYWIDQIKNANGTTESARGTNTLTGTASQDVYIFIPENVDPAQNREIKLSLNIKESTGIAIAEKTFEQYHPAWVEGSNYGWEQTDDNLSGEFGFDWNRLVYYGYVYSYPNIKNPNAKEQYKAYCQSVIDTNNAGKYASVSDYTHGFLNFRWAIRIDYSPLNNVEVHDYNDGLKNTSYLYEVAGSSATGEFENIVSNIYKTENGHTTEKAFRIGDQETGLPSTTGQNSPSSPAIGQCLKKNKYFLLETISQEGDLSYTPVIDVIKWYLPAVNQFPTSSMNDNIQDPIVPGYYWSSTAVVGQNKNQYAFIGNNSQKERSEKFRVRACRNKD